MWSWSIAAFGKKDSVLLSLAAQTYPTTGTDDQGNVTQLTVDPVDEAQFEKAKAEAISMINSTPSLDVVSVGISGNRDGYSSTIKVDGSLLRVVPIS